MDYAFIGRDTVRDCNVRLKIYQRSTSPIQPPKTEKTQYGYVEIRDASTLAAPGLLESIVEVGKKCHSFNETCRGKKGAHGGSLDGGFMFTGGWLGMASQKSRTNNDPARTKPARLLERAAAHVLQYVTDHDPEWLEHVAEWRKKFSSLQSDVPLWVLGGDGEPLGSFLCFTEDYTNASHLDPFDAGKCMAVWVEKEPGKAKNWYFVLPNVFVPETGQKGLVIELFHGCHIKWSGSRVHHCTSWTDTGGDDNHVYSMFYSFRNN